MGNMGSKQRFAYSALGDSVNLASRLEGQTRNYGCSILIGHETQAQVPDFATLELDLIRVKGKSEAVKIHGLLGNDKYRKQKFFAPWFDAHNEMIENYRKQNFNKAEKRIQDCLSLSGGRLRFFYSLYEKRIALLKETPPSKDWDGVYDALTK